MSPRALTFVVPALLVPVLLGPPAPAHAGERQVDYARIGGAIHPAEAPVARVEDDLSAFAVPSFTFPEEELFTEVSAIRGPDAPDYHGTAFWFGGLLGIVHAKGMLDGGISMWDISDPYEPVLVGHGNHPFQREGHSTGFFETEEGWMAVSMASQGINIWDLNDPTRPNVRRNVSLPGILPSDYDFGAWWVAVNGPWIYVAGAWNGLYVVDASNLRRPKLVNQIKIGDGFRCGANWAVGNLLVQTSSEGNRARLYDISDPANPQLIKEVTQTWSSYANHFNGGLLYAAADRGGLEIVDLRDPFSAETLSFLPQSGGGAYTLVQDGFAHLGNSHAFWMIDVHDPRTPVAVGTASITFETEVDTDFVSPMGNLTILSDDHVLSQFSAGSRLVPHQSLPDLEAPFPNFASPGDGATNVPPESRIGFTFSDRILVESVGPESFIVRPVGGEPVAGRFSVQEGLVNFAPDVPLPELTEIEVVLPAGGLADLAGNPIEAAWRATFTTGRLIVNPPIANAGPDVVAQPGAVVQLNAGATAGGVGALSYSWDPGDGSAPSAFSSSPAYTHTYTAEGHYAAIVTVKDEREQITSDEAQVTVVYKALTPRPTSSGPITYEAATDFVWVVNPDADSVSAVDATRHTLVKEVPVGDHPRTVTSMGDNTVWVANQGSGTISVVDTLTQRVIRTLNVGQGSRPYGITVSPDQGTVYVSLEGTGELVALDPVAGTPRWRAAVGPRPRGIACVADRVYVTRFISPATRGEVVEVMAASGALVKTWGLAEDPGPDSDIGGRGVPNYLSQIVPTPDGRRLLVPALKQNTSRGPTRDGQGLTFESTNRAMMAVLDRQTGAEDLGARLDFDNRDHASAVALSAHGDVAFVTLQGSRDVIVVDVFSGQQRGAIDHVGHAPQGAVVDPIGRLWVQNFMGRDVSVWDASLSSTGALAPLGVTRTVELEPLPTDVMTGKRIFYNSSDTRMSRDSYISCAGCHLDGGADLRVWDFTDRGEGLRRTIPLNGRGGMMNGPVHWTANFDEIQDFENDIRNAFGGTGFLSEADWSGHNATLGPAKAGLSPELDAMAAYVASLTEADLSPHRNPDGTLTAAALRGRELFQDEDVGCATCHAGPHFTDSTLAGGSAAFVLHDVGTFTPLSGQRLGGPLTGLDTPTLKGSWNVAPYLHDGSAPTLRDVLLTRNPEDKHGRTHQLSASQLSDLEAYVKAIDARSGGPVVTRLEPPVGSRRSVVDEIVVDLSAWPAASTIGAVRVLREGAAVSGQTLVDRGQLIFVPDRRLVAGAYTVEVGAGLKSIDGEAATAWSGGFLVEDLPLVSAFKAWSSSPSGYKLGDGIRRGSLVYGDNDTRIVKLPSRYEGLPWLMTASADRFQDRPALVEVELSAPATIYAVFPRTQTHLPGWAADFAPTGDTVVITDFFSSPMTVWAGHFPAGKVLLGGARCDGGAGNTVNYFLMFEPEG